MLKKINNEEVKPIPKLEGSGDSRKIKGEALFPSIYSNIFLCAPKMSGKTSCIFKIIQKCCNRDTKILAFVSTLYNDDSWESIQNYCKEKQIYFEGYTGIKDENKVDQLDLFIKMQQEEAKDEKTEITSTKPEQKLLLLGDDEPGGEGKKPRKSKFQAQEWLVILDDLSDELRYPSVATLLKKNRHFKMKVVISSQYYLDLTPSSRKNLEYYLIWPGETLEKLKMIHKDSSVNVSFEKFKEMYDEATKEKYNFFYVDCRRCLFRRNFNSEFQLAN